MDLIEQGNSIVLNAFNNDKRIAYSRNKTISKKDGWSYLNGSFIKGNRNIDIKVCVID